MMWCIFGGMVAFLILAISLPDKPSEKAATRKEHATVSNSSTPAPTPAKTEPLPAHLDIKPYETTADEAFALLDHDGCVLQDQTVKPDSKIPDSLEVKKTYNCSGSKVALYLNRTDAMGPY
jgi:hypothetical protein